MSDVTVRPVASAADKKAYFEFPWKLYKDSPYWVPPLKSIRSKELNKEKSAVWEYMEGEFYLAEKNGEIAGIITAFVNHRHNQTWNENIGWFGDFHFIDDVEVCRALLETAEIWVKAHGYDGIRGPATFTLHAECGVLIGAHDQVPMILTPYNYEYYSRHIEAIGYPKAKDLLNWFATVDTVHDNETEAFQKMSRIVEKNNVRRKITVKTGDPKNKDKDFLLIQELYNTAWKENWGFVPLTERELHEMVADLKDFYEPAITFYAYVDGQPAGYLLGVPDLNQALRKAYPKPNVPEIVTLLRMLWYWKIRSVITSVRVPLMGVKEEYRSLGIDGSLLLASIQKARTLNYKTYTGGWVLEDNTAMNQVTSSLGSHVDRRHRIYQKNLK